MSTKWRLLAVGEFLVGLYLTWRVAYWLAFWMDGLDADTAVLDADCDHCGLTQVLDHIGWVLACFIAYFVLVGVAWSAVRRRHRSPVG